MNAKKRICTQAVQLQGPCIEEISAQATAGRPHKETHSTKYRVPWERRGEGNPGGESSMSRAEAWRWELGVNQPGGREAGTQAQCHRLGPFCRHGQFSVRGILFWCKCQE